MPEWIKALKAWAGSWPTNAKDWFQKEYGLDAEFALTVALLYVALHAAGLNPRVTSGFRDPKKQQAMRDAWDRGDKRGLIVRPADPKKSGHTKTSWTGKPAAKAVDIASSNQKLAADIAQALGLRAGYYFQTSDPGHFDALGA